MSTTWMTIVIAGRRYRPAREARRDWRFLSAIRLGWARLGERKALCELTEAQLRDIGLTPGDVRREIERWPWDGVPR